jgi:predicted nuclease of restriction endonuclease-like RecB superfamily
VAFSLIDFKKTSRKVNGRQVLYPHQLRDDRFLAAISYALDYYERMTGRPRHEFHAETLLEFFGDPKLARGIVACLSRTYTWHQQAFEEVLDAETFAELKRQGLTTPALLRAHLYCYVNEKHHGFLPVTGRAVVLETLCDQLPLSRTEFEDLLTLDAPGNAILFKLAGAPDAREIVALYNYHSLETALGYAESLSLKLQGAIFPAIRTVHNVARRYGLTYTVDHGDGGIFGNEVAITWNGKRDALGGFRGSGRRIVRALLRLLAAHPDAPVSGEAVVHLRGHALHVLLDKRALKTLGAHAIGMGDESWEADAAEQWRAAWSRAFVRGETGGWRLRRDPEPIVTEQGVIVPDFGLQRGPQRAALVLAGTATAAEALVKPLKALAGRSLVVVSTPLPLARKLANLGAIVVPAAETPSPRQLATALPSPTALAEQHTTKWQRLERILDMEGFVDDERIAGVLELAPEQVEQAVRGWKAKELTYLPGIGLCTDDTVSEIRTLLQPERRRAA